MRHQSVGAHRSISRIVAFLAAGVVSAAGVTFADDIMPAGTPSDTRLAIQNAIDAAAVANPVGTVTLGSGTFEIDAQLMVTGGVTLVGQGWERTIIKQTVNGQRVATLDDNSKLEGATITGGRLSASWTHGAGLLVNDGTVSWCCVSNNVSSGRNVHGGGVNITKGTVDHCIIANNQAGTYTSSGGGIGTYNISSTIVIDACLVHGNTVSVTDGGNGYGGAGIGFTLGNPNVTVRNTTITGNTIGGTGGGLRFSGNKVKLVNCIVSGNEAETDADIHGTLASGSSNNLIGDDPNFVDVANGDFHLGSGSPAIGAGVAYEDIGVDLDNVAFGDPPAMGCYEYADLAAAPSFSPEPDSTFYPTASVTLSCETAGASIHYTLDGSTPTDSSMVYTGPIAISATTTIKARAYAAGMGASALVTATYTLKRPTPKPKDFKKCVEITLATNLTSTAITTGIPALVKLSESTISGFRYGDFSLAKGGDMMFVDESGAVLPHEVDTWDTAGESLVWVRLPSTDENTKIVLYYGNGAVSSEEPTDVWTDYVGVWHFNEATGATVANSYGTYANSTATTGIDGNVAQYAVTNEIGRFGKCFRTNDSSAYKGGHYNYGGVWVNDSGTDSPIDGGQNFTISGWFKHGHLDYYWDHMFYKREKSDNTTAQSSYKDAFAIESNAGTGSNPQIRPRGSSSGGDIALNENQGLYDKWGYVTFVYDGSKCYVYENGASKGSSTIAYCKDNDSPLVFGNNCNVASGLEGDAAWNGWIDEVRYSSGSKSAEWVAAEYNAMNAGETDIFTYGEAKRAGAPSAMVIIVR